MKDADGSSIVSEGKPLKRGSPGYGSHEVCLQLNFWCQLELSGFVVWSFANLPGLIILQMQKQVWVQKSSTGS